MYKFTLPILLSLIGFSPLANAQLFDEPTGEDCLQLVPGSFSVGSDPRTLQIAVLLDGVSEAQGRATLAGAQQAYTALGISLAATYSPVSFDAVGANELIAASKAHFGGSRPANTDLVYLLTTTDINEDSVAGFADCIGGIRFADRAFAIGEFSDEDNSTNLGLVELSVEIPAKIMAHELGHLLGGHHHQANCSESALLPSNSGCTLMINDVGLASFGFSTLNGAVSRGAVEAFAGRQTESAQLLGDDAAAGGGAGRFQVWGLLLLLAGRWLLSARRLS